MGHPKDRRSERYTKSKLLSQALDTGKIDEAEKKDQVQTFFVTGMRLSKNRRSEK